MQIANPVKTHSHQRPNERRKEHAYWCGKLEMVGHQGHGRQEDHQRNGKHVSQPGRGPARRLTRPGFRFANKSRERVETLSLVGQLGIPREHRDAEKTQLRPAAEEFVGVPGHHHERRGSKQIRRGRPPTDGEHPQAQEHQDRRTHHRGLAARRWPCRSAPTIAEIGMPQRWDRSPPRTNSQTSPAKKPTCSPETTSKCTVPVLRNASNTESSTCTGAQEQCQLQVLLFRAEVLAKLVLAPIDCAVQPAAGTGRLARLDHRYARWRWTEELDEAPAAPLEVRQSNCPGLAPPAGGRIAQRSRAGHPDARR